MKKILKKNGLKYQRGVALLFALAILSLLMIMAMAFVMNSVFDQKSAYNSASSGNARLLAKSTASRVASLLSFYGDTAAYGDTLNSYVAGGDKDMLDKLTTKVGDSSLFTWNNAKNVTWENIIQNDGVNNRIVGRIAYVVLPVSGLNPLALIANNVDESGSVVAAREQRFGRTLDEINVMSISPEITSGIAQKFNYTSVVSPNTSAVKGTYAAGNWTTYSNFFSSGELNITSGNLRKKFMQWFMIPAPPVKEECYWIDKNGNGKLDTATERYHRFDLTRTVAPTWNTIGSGNPPNSMYSTVLLDANYDGVPDTLPAIYAAAASSGTGIPWLAFLGYRADGTLDTTLGGTFGNSAAGVINRRRQIAANMTDYFDTTNSCTSDIAPTTAWNGTSATNWEGPAYTGNELSPYLNEIGFEIDASVSRTLNSTSANVTVTALACPELINLYPQITSYLSSTVDIYYAYSFDIYYDKGTGPVQFGATVTGASVPPAAWNLLGFTLPASVWPASGPQYTNYTPSNLFTKTVTVTGLGGIGTTASITVKNFKLDINNVLLRYNNVWMDCAKIKNFNPLNTTTARSTWTLLNNAPTAYSPLTATVSKRAYVSYQTNDPRQNLNPGDWCITETVAAGMSGVDKIAPDTATADAGKSLVWTNGTKNTFRDASNNLVPVKPYNNETDRDPEIVDDPAWNKTTGASLSTAYVRQNSTVTAPSGITPWDLGFIHRGAAWQTLNLKEYDKNKANKYIAGSPSLIPGGGAYTDPTPLTPSGGGDANILDQIKIGSGYTANKININSSYTDPNTNRNIVLQAMLDKIIIGAPPSAPATVGAAPVAPATLPKIGTRININEAPVVGHYMDAVTLIASSIMARDKSIDYLTRAQVANAMYTVDDVAPPNNVKRALSQAFCGIQDTDAKQEELIGKFINLCDIGGKVEYFTVIILAQSIKDVGGPSSGTGIAISKKDNNGNVYKFDGITNHGPSVTPAVPPKAKLGTLDAICKTNADGSKTYIYADEVVGEQKVKLFIWRDTSVSPAKSRILSIEYIQ